MKGRDRRRKGKNNFKPAEMSCYFINLKRSVLAFRAPTDYHYYFCKFISCTYTQVVVIAEYMMRMIS